jgi:hypothetical protein
MTNRLTRPLICAIGFIATMLSAPAQTTPAQTKTNPHVNIPIIAAKPEDVGTIEGIVNASYETISGGIGVPRQWGRDRTLYDPDVRFVAIEPDPKSGGIVPLSSSQQDFADHTDAFLVKEGFIERELGHDIHRFGNVATVLSSYEGKVSSTGKVVTRGVNIFQLYYDGKRWWILSMVWDRERPDNPIPPELLAKP